MCKNLRKDLNNAQDSVEVPASDKNRDRTFYQITGGLRVGLFDDRISYIKKNRRFVCQI